MADKFYFFTDIDLIAAQTASETFGPVSGFENSKYRLLSIHSASSTPSAYAICDGVVFVQDDSANPNLVNLVLKPFRQPILGIPAIKYFIYKGIDKGSLIATGGNEIATAGNNDLTQNIWNAQNARNESIDVSNGDPVGTTTDTPPAAALGVNYSAMASSPYDAADVDEISKVFFNAVAEYQLPKVEGGNHIGDFNSTSFGLQIIFDTRINHTTFSHVRQFDDIHEVVELTGGESQAEVFSHWHIKERILHYLDPSAFFGNFYTTGLFAKSSTDVDFSKFTGDDIYTNVLTSFYNKNRVYYDIRGELNNALNYQQNIGDTLLVAFDDTSVLNPIDYYRSNWPILMMDSDFPSGNISGSNTIRFRLPKGNIDNGLLIATAASSVESFPNYLNGKKRFIELKYLSSEPYNINELAFKIPNVIGTTTTPVASYAHFKYVRKNRDTGSIAPTNQQRVIANQYDHVFLPFNMNLNWNVLTGATLIEVFKEEFYIERSAINRESFIANTGMGINSDGSMTMFAFSVQKYQGDIKATKPFTFVGGIYTSLRNTMSVLGDIGEFTNVRKSYYIDGNFTDVDTIETIVKRPEELFLTRNKFNTDEFMYINLSDSEYTTIQNIASNPVNEFASEYPISIKLDLIEKIPLNEDVHCLKYELVLSGYKLDNGAAEIIVNEVSTGIVVLKTGFSVSLNLITF